MKHELQQVSSFVSAMKPTDHVILFHGPREDKQKALFTYLKSGLDQEEAAAYVTSEATVGEIKQAMKSFGIDVDFAERTGALHVIDYRDWYIIDGNFDAPKTMRLWKKLYDDVLASGFRGLRVTGEMACFFRENRISALVDYEKALHRVLDVPMTAICVYNFGLVPIEVFHNLIEAHSNVIFLGPIDNLLAPT